MWGCGYPGWALEPMHHGYGDLICATQPVHDSLIVLISHFIALNCIGVMIESVDFPGRSDGQESACQCRRPEFNLWVGKIPLEKGMATHPSILAWKTPWTKEPGGLQSTGLQRVGHN